LPRFQNAAELQNNEPRKRLPNVVNYGGPGEIVSDDCGIRLAMAPRDQLVDRLWEAMTKKPFKLAEAARQNYVRALRNRRKTGRIALT
jgi:hypothetical protein